MQQSLLFRSRERAPDEPPSPPSLPPDDDPPEGDGTVALLDAARERYLNYALSVITSRALPDVRDGLKPVHRRILYAMFANLRLTHTARFRKSAAVVGEVMARFHPHGDQSIYDAMVRLAQPFSLRAPLVEGHGNFGSLDGDSAAAMRYTEVRLRSIASEMVEEIDQDTVPFRANYDGTTEEPIVLPSRIPQLLVNGSAGIAVGMATNIPPHNLREICSAAIAMIEKPKITLDELMEHIQGPDFPIGGEILNSPEQLRSIYETGRGAVRLRASYHLEKANRRRYLIISSLPYGQLKSNVVEQIGELIRESKVPQLTDVRDESTNDIRIVCELKRSASEAEAMAYLFKHTNLRTNFHVNLTALVPTANPEVGRPALLGLSSILRHFLDFRFDVVTRRFRYELERLRQRIHILRGYAIVFDALDEAIQIIRGSDGRKDASTALRKRFPLTEVQCNAILDLKLYRLAKMEVEAVLEELARLEAEAKRIEAVLKSKKARWEVIHGELAEVARTHGDDRRSEVVGPETELHFDPEAYIVDEDTWVIVTRGGWIKRQRGFSDIKAIRVREGDAVMSAFRVSTKSTTAFFTDRGRCYVTRTGAIVQTSGYGEPIQATFQFADGEQVIATIPMDARLLPDYRMQLPEVTGDLDAIGEDSLPGEDEIEEEDAKVTVVAETPSGDAAEAAGPETQEGEVGDEDTDEDLGPVALAITKAGKGILFPLNNHFEISTKNGRKFASLGRGKDITDGVVSVQLLDRPELKVCLASHSGRVLVFPAESLKLLRRSGRGVNAIRLKPGDEVIDFALVEGRGGGLEVQTSRGRDLRVTERRYGLKRRGVKGHEVIKRGTLRTIEKPATLLDARMGVEDEEMDGELDALDGEGAEGAEGEGQGKTNDADGDDKTAGTPDEQ